MGTSQPYLTHVRDICRGECSEAQEPKSASLQSGDFGPLMACEIAGGHGCEFVVFEVTAGWKAFSVSTGLCKLNPKLELTLSNTSFFFFLLLLFGFHEGS